jgi:hypothetical protein
VTFSSLNRAAGDAALNARTNACVQQESRNNPTLSVTAYAEQVRTGQVSVPAWFAWPIAIATEAEYAYAISTDPPNPNPGGDPGVISDGEILSAVQANWPPDPVTPTA